MPIELASDLDGYEFVDACFPCFNNSEQEKLDKLIKTHQLLDDPLNVFYLSSIDRFFIVTFKSDKHERDSSGYVYALYKRK